MVVAVRPMTSEEAREMMIRCRDEITHLRKRLSEVEPKADAYDSIRAILGMMPQRSVGMAEDLVWRLQKRIDELTPKAEG